MRETYRLSRGWCCSFILIFLCLLPFIAGGVTISGLGKLRPSSPLFALCIAAFTFVGYTPTLSAILVARFFPGGGGVRSVLRQVKTRHAGIGWYAIAVFGPTVLFLLDETINLLFGGFTTAKVDSLAFTFWIFPWLAVL